ncbi:hypothetical protein EfmJHP10_08260 [Enterococcus faecium]|nr:hypothetical protein EfmJHP10_08260 [Enterococcus faecium]
MKLSVEGTPEEIQELLQAIGSSKEQKVSVSNSDIDFLQCFIYGVRWKKIKH